MLDGLNFRNDGEWRNNNDNYPLPLLGWLYGAEPSKELEKIRQLLSKGGQIEEKHKNKTNGNGNANVNSKFL